MTVSVPQLEVDTTYTPRRLELCCFISIAYELGLTSDNVCESGLTSSAVSGTRRDCRDVWERPWRGVFAMDWRGVATGSTKADERSTRTRAIARLRANCAAMLALATWLSFYAAVARTCVFFLPYASKIFRE